MFSRESELQAAKLMINNKLTITFIFSTSENCFLLVAIRFSLIKIFYPLWSMNNLMIKVRLFLEFEYKYIQHFQLLPLRVERGIVNDIEGLLSY